MSYPKDMGKAMNCWEFKDCGDAKRDCPAYPKGGRVCYMLAGTLCNNKVQGVFALKINDCRKCDFYREVISHN